MTEHTVEYTLDDGHAETDVRIRFNMPFAPEWGERTLIEWLSAKVIKGGHEITAGHPLHKVIDRAWDNDDNLYIAALEAAEAQLQPEEDR